MKTIIENLQKCQARHILLILDCCYSGIATREGKTPNKPAKADEKYFKDITSRKAIQVLAAGEADQPVNDSGKLPGYSAFTGALLEILTTGKDLDGDGLLTISEIGQKIKHLIREHTKDKLFQKPVVGDIIGHEGGDLVLKVFDQSKGQTEPELKDKDIELLIDKYKKFLGGNNISVLDFWGTSSMIGLGQILAKVTLNPKKYNFSKEDFDEIIKNGNMAQTEIQEWNKLRDGQKTEERMDYENKIRERYTKIMSVIIKMNKEKFSAKLDERIKKTRGGKLEKIETKKFVMKFLELGKKISRLTFMSEDCHKELKLGNKSTVGYIMTASTEACDRFNESFDELFEEIESLIPDDAKQSEIWKKILALEKELDNRIKQVKISFENVIEKPGELKAATKGLEDEYNSFCSQALSEIFFQYNEANE